MNNFCPYCGKENKLQSKYCPSCGAEFKEVKAKAKTKETVKAEKVEDVKEEVKEVKVDYTTNSKKTSELAIVGFVLSLVGLLCCGSFFFGLGGVIVSSIALSRFNPEKETGKGFAIAGLVIGIIAMLVSLFAAFLNVIANL